MSIASTVALLAALALPEGTARYRVEVGGETIGAAELVVRCEGPRCQVVFETRLRLPEEAGGAVTARRFETDVDRDGRATGGIRRTRDRAVTRDAAPAGRVPAALAESLLASAAREGEGTVCLEAFEEETLVLGRACGAWEGGVLGATVLGVRERVAPGPGGFPAAIELPEQGTRFVRDVRAAVPPRPPSLAVRVTGPADPARAASFCGVPLDPPPPAPVSRLPAPAAPGESCREKTAAYLARAAARGHDGRTALGVAWDGARFVWHAWAEVRDGDRYVPVDPAFGELPARGPRFTVARYGPGDGPAALAAGRRVVACWGRAAVLAR
ncbi:transglutaminase domain-containing protein [Anaeromyxobacter terrae]|uniref:transglutaminase domain-containing protein n=1 Tax=Anaeromyxobacter terrae TaxID=2925406 RepID=UPI001F58B701|nr:transglutaminase domain-containing protein [Anaeromyxobacter sp. SG22]